MKKKLMYSVFIILAGAFWGVMGIFVRTVSEYGFTSLQVSALRTASAALLFFIFALIYDRNLFRIKLRDLPLFFAIAIFSVVALSWLYSYAMVQIDLSVAAILLYTAPIWVLAASVLLYGEKLNRKKLIALALALAGCVLVSGFSAKPMPIMGVFCGFGSGIAYALYSIIGKYILKKYSPLTVTLYSFLIAGIVSLLLCDFSEIGKIAAVNLNAEFVFKVFGFGFVTAFLPFILYTIGLSKTPAGKASIMASAEPMVATLSGIVVYKEVPGIGGILGILMIISAIVLLNWKNNEN